MRDDLSSTGAGRHGALTFMSVLMAACFVAASIAVALVLGVPTVDQLAALRDLFDPAIDPVAIPIAVLLSATTAWGGARTYRVRSGGFVAAAVGGMLLGEPWQVVAVASSTLVTYLFVTRVLMRSMILVGRRRLSTMLLVAGALSALSLRMGTEFFHEGTQQHVDLGPLVLAPLFILGLLTNDAQRTSPPKVAIGLALAGSFVMTTTWWTHTMLAGLELAIWWKLIAIVSFGAIFGRLLIPARVHAWIAANVSITMSPADTQTPPAVGALATGGVGFEHWAARHRDAAADAERWLAAALGEPEVATAGGPQTMRKRPHHERFSIRVRRAAERARSSEPDLPDTDGLPIRALKPKPRPRNGEFDAVATGIAAGVRRPRSLPRRERGVALVRARQTPLSEDTVQAARVQLELLPDHQQFTEPTAAATRANHVAPGARHIGPSDLGIGPIA